MNADALFEINRFWVALFAATLLFCWQLPHRQHFYVKFGLGIGAQAAFALIWSKFFDNFSSQGVLSVCSRYLIHFFLLMAIVLLCYECDMSGASFCVMCGYSLQHIASRICVILWKLVDAPWKSVRYTVGFIILFVLCIVAYRVFRKVAGGVVNVIRVDSSRQWIIIVVALFSTNIIEMAQFLHQIPSANLIERISGPAESIILSCGVLILEFWLLSHSRTEKERNTLKEIVQEKRHQTEMEKKMVETVNINAHDLKHKISEGYVSEEVRKDIVQIVDEFDTSLCTGNESLDVILTKKKRYCFQHDIQFICIVDGQKLSFMGEADTFTLMGNILDNAIEAVEQLESSDDRIIYLNIVGKDSFVHIRTENYFRGELSFSSNVPTTTKEDKDHHGYGLKSIVRLVEKYGGHYKLFTGNNMFILDILFPVQNDNENKTTP